MVLMRLIMRGKFEFLSPYWDSVSDQAKDLVSKLLSTNPAQRLTASDAMVHPWMQPMPAQMPPAAGSSRFKVASWVVLACMRMQTSARARRQQPTPGSRDTDAAGLAAQLPSTDLSYTNYPVSVTDTMYKDQRVRKAIDECAFRCVSMAYHARVHTSTHHYFLRCRIYGHWVKKSNAQNRAALFENYLIRHTS